MARLTRDVGAFVKIPKAQPGNSSEFFAGVGDGFANFWLCSSDNVMGTLRISGKLGDAIYERRFNSDEAIAEGSLHRRKSYLAGVCTGACGGMSILLCGVFAIGQPVIDSVVDKIGDMLRK